MRHLKKKLNEINNYTYVLLYMTNICTHVQLCKNPI